MGCRPTSALSMILSCCRVGASSDSARDAAKAYFDLAVQRTATRRQAMAAAGLASFPWRGINTVVLLDGQDHRQRAAVASYPRTLQTKPCFEIRKPEP